MPSGPKDGDTVLHCGHLDGGGHHFWKVDDLPFRPPNTTNLLITAQWIFQCDECQSKMPKKPKNEDFVIRGHNTWVGDEPCIQNPIHEQN